MTRRDVSPGKVAALCLLYSIHLKNAPSRGRKKTSRNEYRTNKHHILMHSYLQTKQTTSPHSAFP